ncbi:hypothetical protein [Streptomyces sp. NPDC023327]
MTRPSALSRFCAHSTSRSREKAYLAAIETAVAQHPVSVQVFAATETA